MWPATAGSHAQRVSGIKKASRSEVAFALKKCGGDFVMAAEMLQCTVAQLKWAVDRDDQLRALYGARGFASEVPVPAPEDTRDRTPEDLPDGTIPASSIEMVDIVSEQDMAIMRKGLKKMGASEDMLQKLKDIDKLAVSGGKMLAISLQVTHRYYFLQTLGIFEEIDALKKILRDDANETDLTKKMSHEDRRGYLMLYGDLVTITGNAYKLNLTGTEAIFRMQMAANRRGVRTKAPKPGFGAVAPEAPNGQG